MSEPREAYAVTAAAIEVPATMERDERAVIEAMRAVESDRRPGLLTLYYNGTGWLLYDNTRPRYLSPSYK